MRSKERTDRLEGMIHRMASHLSEYVLATSQMTELCSEIDMLPPSEQQERISRLARKILGRMNAAQHSD